MTLDSWPMLSVCFFFFIQTFRVDLIDELVGFKWKVPIFEKTVKLERLQYWN